MSNSTVFYLGATAAYLIVLVLVIRQFHWWRAEARRWRAYATADDLTEFFAFLRERAFKDTYYDPVALGWERYSTGEHTHAHRFKIEFDGIVAVDPEPLQAWRKYRAMREAKYALIAVGDELPALVRSR